MANISGTNIAAPIVPFTTDDSFATHDSQYGKGGWREIKTYNEINSIPKNRQTEGMAVYVVETEELYILKNSNWHLFKASAKANTFVFEQNVDSKVWEISHNLGKFPSISVFDTAGTEMLGDIQYIDNNTVNITFSEEIRGTAYLN